MVRKRSNFLPNQVMPDLSTLTWLQID